MYRRTGSATKALVNASGSTSAFGAIVFSICGGSSIDIVARFCWSVTRSS
jgi:hypothetical protein